MSSADVDRYLDGLEEPRRTTLQAVRRSILAVIPAAEEGLAYGAPAFRVEGRTVAGFAAYTHHLSYLPHSGTVLADVGDDLAGYETSKGALRFPVDTPLPAPLVDKLVAARLRELGLEGS